MTFSVNLFKTAHKTQHNDENNFQRRPRKERMGGREGDFEPVRREIRRETSKENNFQNRICPAGAASRPGWAWQDSLACPSLRGPILSARAERIGRKARQREGLFTKPPFPLESHPPKFAIDARFTHYRARARPPAVPRNRTGSGMSVYVLSGASVGNGFDRSGGFWRVSFFCAGAAGRPGWHGGGRRLVRPSGGRFFPFVRKESEERHAKGKGFAQSRPSLWNPILRNLL
jgi:hypothetical protein